MNATVYSRPFNCISNFSSRRAPQRRKLLLGRSVFVLFLLAPGGPTFAQRPLEPAKLSFGNQVVNQSSAALTATLKNSEAEPLAIRRIAIDGGNASSDFVLGGDCPVSPRTLSTGASCRITVTFTPSALGPRTATLTVARIAPDAGIAPDARIAASEARRGGGQWGQVRYSLFIVQRCS